MQAAYLSFLVRFGRAELKNKITDTAQVHRTTQKSNQMHDLPQRAEIKPFKPSYQAPREAEKEQIQV